MRKKEYVTINPAISPMVMQQVNGPRSFSMAMTLPVLTPYFNQWCQNAYTRRQAFEDHPESLMALSTSGSVVVLGERGFVGFTGHGPLQLQHDGQRRLHVVMSKTRTAYVAEQTEGYSAWRAFNAQQNLASTPAFEHVPDFWTYTEYGTWVEQRACCNGQSPQKFLSDDFVQTLLMRIERLNLPKGKFVIDHGWAFNEPKTMGDWEPDPHHFADMAETAQRIADAGHVPGLWLAPVQMNRQSIWAKRHPTEVISWTPPADNQMWGDVLVKPGRAAADYYRQMAERVVAWGFRKIKADLYYGPRRLMIENLNLFAQAVHDVDPTVEVESHIPDPEVSDACAVVRTNDVLVTDAHDWRDVTCAHFEICTWSCPHKILNYDFIGGNAPEVTETNFRAHGELYRQYATRGYACVGLLPDRFSEQTQAWFVELIQQLHDRTAAGRAAVLSS